MLLDDTVHFTLCVWREALKAEADSKGRVGVLVMKLAGGCGIRSRPDHPGGQCSVRRAGFMGPGVFLGLCDGEMQCGNTIQEFRASVEVKTGTVSAEVGGERFEAVTFPGRICEIKPDWELQGHPYGLTGIVIFPLAWCEGVAGSQFDLRLCRKQDFKGEGYSLFLRSLDQRSQDGGLLLAWEAQTSQSAERPVFWFGVRRSAPVPYRATREFPPMS